MSKYLILDEVTDRIKVGGDEWVDIKAQMVVDDYDIMGTERDEGKGVVGCMLRANIKAWSFKDKAGKPLPVNAENVGKLTTHASVQLMVQINKRNPPPKV